MKRVLNPQRAWLALLLGLLGWVGVGCSTTGEMENRSDRPWNQPTRWETGLPSSVYDRR